MYINYTTTQIQRMCKSTSWISTECVLLCNYSIISWCYY